MKLPLLILFSFISASLLSQGENNEWIFGEGVHLSFKSGRPIPVYDMPSVKTLEGSTSVSDAKGNLLFYSDGLAVYDRIGDLMRNGDGLLGNKSSTSSAVAVPYPGNPEKYFLFCVDQNLSTDNKGVSYNIIDMSGNYRKGEVVLKNRILKRNTDEKIAVTSKCGGDGYWVVIHKAHSDSFLAYSITSKGIDTNPVVSICNTSRYKLPEIGYMKFSPTGRYMVNANTLTERIELFKFDKKNGRLNLLACDQTQYHRNKNPEEQTYYGVAFSAKENFLYASTLEGGEILQYDLSEPEKTFETRTLITKLNHAAGALQLGPDNLLYLPGGYDSHHLHRIQYPEKKGSLCKFNKDFIFFAGKEKLNIGLPTLIEYTISYFNLGSDIIIQLGGGQKEAILDARIPGGKYLWSTGETTKTITVKDTGGIFWVKASDSNACLYYTDTIRVLFAKDFNYSGPPMPNKEYCSNSVFPGISFTTYEPNISFIWSNSNPFIGLPEYGSGNIKPYHLPYTTGYINTTITVYPVKGGYVGKPFNFDITILPSPLVDTSKLIDKSFCHGDTFKLVRLSALPYWRQLKSNWYNLDSIPGLAKNGQTIIGSFICSNLTSSEDTFRIKVMAYDAACASLPYTFRVIMNPVPALEKVNDVNICSGTIVPAPVLKAVPANVKYAYSIPQLGGNFIELPGNILNWIPIPKTPILFKQDIIVRPIYKGCKGNPDTFNVIIKPAPLSAFTYHINDPDTSFTAIPFTLVNTSKRYNSFEWQLGLETDTLNLTKTISIPTNKVFTVTLLTKNEYGCTDQFSSNLPTERKPVMYVPNAFSPNCDGINDLFTVHSMGMQSWNIRILNSWGEMVYEGNNTQEVWDGFYRNEPCQNGTYMWYTKAIDVSGESYSFKGTVLLNR